MRSLLVARFLCPPARRFYVGRDSGRHRHHWHAGRTLAAGGAKGPRGGADRFLREQPQADRPGPGELRGPQRILSAELAARAQRRHRPRRLVRSPYCCRISSRTTSSSTLNYTLTFENASRTLVTLADGTTAAVTSLRIPTFMCPAEKQDTARLKNGVAAQYPLNYAVNLGTWFVWDPTTGNGGNGMFYPGSKLRERHRRRLQLHAMLRRR